MDSRVVTLENGVRRRDEALAVRGGGDGATKRAPRSVHRDPRIVPITRRRRDVPIINPGPAGRLDVMTHHRLWKRIDGRAIALLLALWGAPASGQGLGASKPESDQPAARPSRLGPTPGAGANPLGDSPGEGGAVLENRTGGPRSTSGSGAQGVRIETGPEGGAIGLADPVEHRAGVAVWVARLDGRGRGAVRRPDARPGDRTADRPQPRPPLQAVRDPPGRRRHPHRRPPGQPDPLHRRPVRTPTAPSPGSAGRAARPSTTSTSPIRSTSPASGRPGPSSPAGPREVLQAQFQDADPGRDRQPLHRVRRRPGREGDRPPGEEERRRAGQGAREAPRPRPAPCQAPTTSGWRSSASRPRLGLVEAEEQYKSDLRALGQVLLGMTVAAGRAARAPRVARRPRPAAGPGRAPAPPRPGQPPRPRRLPPGRPPRRGRRRPGRGQPLSRRLRPLSALHVPGRPLPQRQERHLLGRRRVGAL